MLRTVKDGGKHYDPCDRAITFFSHIASTHMPGP
jgi:hypothetical protein